MIRGGYYIKARCIQNSDIAHAAPHVREIWDWLIKEANHADTEVCKRGQCIRTYKDIQEGLCWFVGYRKMSFKKHQCENALKWLRKADMIRTTKTTRGIVITICNYDKFQNPENYDCYTKHDTSATMKLQPQDTINKNDKNEKKKNIYPAEFEQIWKSHSKGGKMAALKAWKKAKDTDLPEQSELLSILEKHKIYWKQKGFAYDLSTWLNGAYWHSSLGVQGETPIRAGKELQVLEDA